MEKIRFDLIEILNTKLDISWTDKPDGLYGTFDLDNTVSYEIQLKDFEATLTSKKFYIVEIGFSANGKFVLTNKGGASKVFGAVINGIIPKLKELKPDIILFGLNNTNSAIESRKTLYSALASWYQRGSSFTHLTDWILTPNGQYKLLSKGDLTDHDLEEINSYAKDVLAK